MPAKSKIVPESRDYDFLINLTKTEFQCLQAYLVPIERDCKHIQFDSDLRLQAYSVPLIIDNASILDPNFNHYCKHIYSVL